MLAQPSNRKLKLLKIESELVTFSSDFLVYLVSLKAPHLRVHVSQDVGLEPVSSLAPSKVLSIVS